MDDGDISALRREYLQTGLDEAELHPDPVTQSRLWLHAAVEAGFTEPTAMTLATVGVGGAPAARMVLLKGLDARGFAFYTHYHSAKARELEANPRAALVFCWTALERQIRVSGSVSRTSPEESDAYFATRPYGSQIAAWASPQSETISNRTALEARRDAAAARYREGEVPRPPDWGGYRLAHEQVEFWQGRADRLHDRLRYRRQGEGWLIERLAP